MSIPRHDRPQVTSLPALDRELAVRGVEREVFAKLRPTDPIKRAAAAAALLARYEESLRAAYAARDAAAWTIETRYWARRGASPSHAMGVGRTRWQTIRERQAALDPDPVPDAPEVLPALSRQVARLEEAVWLTTVERDAAVCRIDAEVTHAAVGRLIGRDHAVVSHIRNRAKQLLAEETRETAMT